VAAVNAKHLVNQLVKHLVPLAIKVAKKLNNDVFVSSDFIAAYYMLYGKQ